MTMTIYGVCPNCGAVVSKQVTRGNASQVDSISYRKGEKCRTNCYGRTARQAPKVRKEKT